MNLSETFLGIIAVATLLMALVQVGAIVAILRVARQAQQTIAEVHRDVRPLIEKATIVAAKATALADEASRTSQTMPAMRPESPTADASACSARITPSVDVPVMAT